MKLQILSTINKGFLYCVTLSRMSGQAKISTFFRTLGTKCENVESAASAASASATGPSKLTKPKMAQLAKENVNVVSEEPDLKKQKLVDNASPEKEEIKLQPNSSPLSPSQRCTIEKNKTLAKMKLLTKTTHGLVQNIGQSWLQALEQEFTKPYFEKLSKFVHDEREKGTVFPPADQVFTFANMCPIEDVKVVILGQDPYHGPRQAHGLCFSVQPGVPPPPSLVNMYKELQSDIEGFKNPGHGFLIGWSKQGVLLLNAVLTVRAHTANSHKDRGWEKHTDAIISWLNKNQRGIVFILWGAYAHKKGACIDKSKHHILKGVHPSPLSAHRGFFGCKHFSKCNELLEQQDKTPIDWKQLPEK